MDEHEHEHVTVDDFRRLEKKVDELNDRAMALIDLLCPEHRAARLAHLHPAPAPIPMIDDAPPDPAAPPN